ncbi:MAG TPA: hypothetical protein VNJ01_02185 [Bacteriovoracaceae bacterium]|nr:hypothetical protein [Bacteriovoracaceae bacterium]
MGLGLPVLLLSLALSAAHAHDAVKCPERTKAKLEEWRDGITKLVIEAKYAEAKKAVDKCFPDEAPGCYGDLLYYLDFKSNPYQYPSPFDVERSYPLQEQYLKTFKDLPKELQKSPPNPNYIYIPPDIKKIADQKGWKNILYQTRSTGGFDGSGYLFLFAVSTPELDIIIQPSPGNNDKSNLHHRNVLTVITIDKTKDPRVGQMKRFFNEGKKGTYRWDSKVEADGCIECHASPYRPISPLGYGAVDNGSPMSVEDQKTVTELNQMLGGQQIAWAKTMVNGKEVRSGPPIDSKPWGWVPEPATAVTRKKEFLLSCGATAENADQVREAMNCFGCHNNKDRNIIHDQFKQREIRFKILGDKSMPHNMTNLGDPERLALYKCLVAENNQTQDEWKNSGLWMKQMSCRGNQFKGKPVTPVKNQTKKKVKSQ